MTTLFQDDSIFNGWREFYVSQDSKYRVKLEDKFAHFYRYEDGGFVKEDTVSLENPNKLTCKELWDAYQLINDLREI